MIGWILDNAVWIILGLVVLWLVLKLWGKNNDPDPNNGGTAA